MRDPTFALTTFRLNFPTNNEDNCGVNPRVTIRGTRGKTNCQGLANFKIGLRSRHSARLRGDEIFRISNSCKPLCTGG